MTLHRIVPPSGGVLQGRSHGRSNGGLSSGTALGNGKLQRHTRNSLCPICRGHVELPQGRGVRCAGFTLDRVAFCTREEYAGSLPLDISTSPAAYKHYLFGQCGCGVQHGWNAIGVTSPVLRLHAGEQHPQRLPTLKSIVPIETRHAIYSAVLDLLELRKEARDDLNRRGLSHEAAMAMGYRSLPRRGTDYRKFMQALLDRFGEQTLRQCPGFTDKNGRLNFWTAYEGRDGYVVPYLDEHSRISGLQAKILGGKYLTARGTILSVVYHVTGIGSPGADLYLTESATKANIASYLAGLWVFAVAGQSFTPEHVKVIQSLRPGRVIVALDQEDNANMGRR
jgi:hypothetical protein